MSEVTGVGEPKLRDPNIEHQESQFGIQIGEAYETLIKALKRLGVITEHKSKDGVHHSVNYGKLRVTDLSNIPWPESHKTVGYSPTNDTQFEIGFMGGSREERLHLSWKSPGRDDEQSIIITARHYNGATQKYEPYYYISYKEKESGYKGQAVRRHKTFSGKFGEGPEDFSQKDYIMGAGNPKTVAAALDAKARTVPHPNPVARLFGR